MYDPRKTHHGTQRYRKIGDIQIIGFFVPRFFSKSNSIAGEGAHSRNFIITTSHQRTTLLLHNAGRTVRFALGFDAGTREAGCLRRQIFTPAGTVTSRAGLVAATTIATATALMFLVCVKLGTVNGLDMLPQRRWIRVPFCTARSFANIRFLDKESQ